ncbi:gamma-aminobutyric acid receptor subunit beta-2 isoform X2 [Nematostella vectensis]|uniref:gamma-aminobutyric acid receptor subunit beta-2 isoform X2 n=1 Tax=Nematostella vectensis TaxID=45351 RepID=UPI0020774CCC|nr:gamma-aminobutyric acid receptor subunit beta-2 isoform X2 [Nematostella vectensis]
MPVVFSLIYRLFSDEEEAENKRQQEYAKNTTKTLDRLKSSMDKRLRPFFGGKPVVVYVDIYIVNIGEISVTNMDYKLMLYYRQTWHDPRLAFDLPEAITVQGGMLNDIWIPDTLFTNEKSSTFHKVTQDNYLLSIWPNGTTYLSMRISLTGICPMDLRKYPMDTQTCYLNIMSYSGSTDNLILKWKFGETGSVTWAENINLPQMDVLGVKGREVVDVFASGNFSRLSLAFKFKRRISLFLTETYVPLVLIVALSWVSFWINYKVAPARVALCITTVLTIITLSASVRTSLPKVTYTKYSDWILITGLVYVFGALVEYAVVNYFDNAQAKKNVAKAVDVENAKETEETGDELPKQEKETAVRRARRMLGLGEVQVETIDIRCRWMVPASFIVLNLIYWIYFIIESSED